MTHLQLVVWSPRICTDILHSPSSSYTFVAYGSKISGRFIDRGVSDFPTLLFRFVVQLGIVMLMGGVRDGSYWYW